MVAEVCFCASEESSRFLAFTICPAVEAVVVFLWFGLFVYHIQFLEYCNWKEPFLYLLEV